jgi:hypothetical protein
MKKIITIVGLLLAVSVTPAQANCPSGVCDVEVNVATGVVTYRDAAPRTIVPEPVPAPVAPTSMVKVVTPNESFGASGSAEGVTEALQNAVTRSTNPEFIAAAQQATVEEYKPEPPLTTPVEVMNPKRLTADEAYLLIEWYEDDWIEQFFAWCYEYWAEYYNAHLEEGLL